MKRPFLSEMLPRRTALMLGALVFALAGFSSAHAETKKPEPEEAKSFVQQLADNAIAVLSSSASGSERDATFDRILTAGFDLDAIGRFALGRHWNRATPEQQAEYRTLFQRFVLRKYSTLLSTYSGQKFRVERVADLSAGDVLVLSVIEQSNAEPIKADWRVRRVGGELKIVDIRVEGISMVTAQRDEFAAVIKNSGIEGLLALLRKEGSTSANAVEKTTTAG
ncbi:MAG: ABC transporter substrate-binding protein [Alphaproteobacteria bacterium]|nr:ABC transporter substrate-binding protein [Alphaproteobacteria bacterium]